MQIYCTMKENIYIIFYVYVYDACKINKVLIYGWRYTIAFDLRKSYRL